MIGRSTMLGKVRKIRSRDGREFDCYLVAPKAEDPTPAVVIASAIHGVDADIRWIADDLAAQGFIVAAPDLFWRSIPGPLPRDDHRAVRRSQPRPELIKLGEDDIADTLTYLCTLPNFNGGAAAIISICDSGPGIPQDRLNEIFDPFFTTKEQGMGIGLSIARTIVLAHSGQIWAENQSGGGAAFHLSLPLAA